MYLPFEEMTWQQFMQQPQLKRLTLQEQVAQYDQYLFELSIARQSWIEYQNKGSLIPLPPSNVVVTNTDSGSISISFTPSPSPGIITTNWSTDGGTTFNSTSSTVNPIGVTGLPSGSTVTVVLTQTDGNGNTSTGTNPVTTTVGALPSVLTNLVYSVQSSSLSSSISLPPLSPANAKCTYIYAISSPTTTSGSQSYPQSPGVIISSFTPLTVGSAIYEYNTLWPLSSSVIATGSYVVYDAPFSTTGSVYTVATSGSDKIIAAITPFSSLPSC
jgi:hypothetical protein